MSDDVKTHYTVSDRENTRVDFGIQDEKGRAVGTIVVRSVAVYVPAVPDADGYISSYSRCLPGTYFVAEVQLTRDGRAFGASQATRQFGTVEEREAYIAKYLVETPKRVAKDIAKRILRNAKRAQ